jgi:4-alpha-glucanotransferase
MKRRGSGILLHITSLPSPYGIGDLGPEAYRFADFLAETKQSFWQVLPLDPTDTAHGNSPYSSISAFAGNPLLISPQLLVERDLLTPAELDAPSFSPERVNYWAATQYKEKLLQSAYNRQKQQGKEHAFEKFCHDHAFWLEDYTLFKVLKQHFQGAIWSHWPAEIRDRDAQALQRCKEQFQEQIVKEQFLQYLFFTQWAALQDYCNNKGIQIIGDIPIYVHYDSVDVWAHPELFKLAAEKQPVVVAGVPPDYFSATGQRWGNPVYNWNILQNTRYAWWVKRVKHNLSLFNLVRLDHFRGFVAYWEVPAGEPTAINGKWVEGPAVDFFFTLLTHFPYLPLIAEDLGLITPDVREVMHHFAFPGMKVLLFAFGGDLSTHPYIPHNYTPEYVVYTGTHDTNTVQGWFKNEAQPAEKKRLFAYIGREVPPEQVHWELIRLAMMSVANTAIIPMQDILGLGTEARMNLPSTPEGNWEWRLVPGQLTPALRQQLFDMTVMYGRGR